ncbi:MAG: prepilin-type N-terminal cleavage/methylation domain-containing protein [bacterium]
MINLMHNRKKGPPRSKRSFALGFTLIETLVAIAILVLAVMGAMSAAQRGISSSSFSKDQVIAFYLAQEGVEQIRNIRDENALNDLPWLTGISANLSDACYFNNVCRVDTLSITPLVRCSGAGECPVLRQDAITGFFGYDVSWPTTQFRREVILNSINTDEISILVTVDWSKGGTTKQFRIRENILNWQ